MALRTAPLLLALALAGCVTTKSSAVFNPTNEAEIIQRHVEAASAYLERGNTTQAVVHLKKALEVNSRSAPVHEALARVFVRTGEFELAEEHFRKSIDHDGSFTRARNNYASMLYQLGRYQEAYDQLEIVVADTLYKSRPAAFVSLGICALKLGRVDRAEEAFNRALLMNERLYVASLELAMIYFDRKDYPKANFYYGEYRKRKPAQALQSPRSLLLGIRLARVFEDRDAEASYALALKNLYPTSQEYLEYRDSTQ